MPQYKEGTKVRYKPVGGEFTRERRLCESLTPYQGPDSNTSESVGVILSVLTEPGVQADRNVNASEEDPRYEVSNNSIQIYKRCSFAKNR